MRRALAEDYGQMRAGGLFLHEPPSFDDLMDAGADLARRAHTRPTI